MEHVRNNPIPCLETVKPDENAIHSQSKTGGTKEMHRNGRNWVDESKFKRKHKSVDEQRTLHQWDALLMLIHTDG